MTELVLARTLDCAQVLASELVLVSADRWAGRRMVVLAPLHASEVVLRAVCE
ncbi:hypothetical protein PR001_g26322 [Phytophthora rubi]|uniref:Uncharacterized protein n=1 Tax=Phytophthora rubi TaxID=129364 RepID=A0A6A3HRU0_9STRA|nr:hypothetical protein PR001_g26322 [Phytophthora rubi]